MREFSLGKVSVCEWDELTEDEQDLLKRAAVARSLSLSFVSNFSVGAAILAYNGKIYSAGNYEDIALNGTSHGESGCIILYLSDPERGDNLGCKLIAIVLGPKDTEIICPPPPVASGDMITDKNQIKFACCGHCLCLLDQYAGPDARVLAMQPNGEIAVCS
jgi:cytidine deaminase